MNSPRLLVPITTNQNYFNKYYFNKYYYKTFGDKIIKVLGAFRSGDVNKYIMLKSLEVDLVLLKNSGKKITNEEYEEIKIELSSYGKEINGIEQEINYIIFKIGYILVGK